MGQRQRPLRAVCMGPGSSNVSNCDFVGPLPPDAPRWHRAHVHLRYQARDGDNARMRFTRNGVFFQTMPKFCKGSRHAAEVIARACWLKFEEGWAKPAVTAFRDQCYARWNKEQEHASKSLMSRMPKDRKMVRPAGRDVDAASSRTSADRPSKVARMVST